MNCGHIAIAIPPLPEQHAIAAALCDVDARITSLERLIAKKRDIKQAAMQELLTGKTRLPGFGGEWEVQYSLVRIAPAFAKTMAPKSASNWI